MQLLSLKDQLLFSYVVFRQKWKEENNVEKKNNYSNSRVCTESYFQRISLFLTREQLLKAWMSFRVKTTEHGEDHMVTTWIDENCISTVTSVAD